MTKRFFIGLGIALVSVIGFSVFYANENNVNDSNVGNGEEYIYQVTNVENNEINGIAVNKKSDDNAGIFLFADEVDFDIEVGDKIAVVWGAEEDIFKSIEKID